MRFCIKKPCLQQHKNSNHIHEIISELIVVQFFAGIKILFDQEEFEMES